MFVKVKSNNMKQAAQVIQCILTMFWNGHIVRFVVIKSKRWRITDDYYDLLRFVRAIHKRMERLATGVTCITGLSRCWKSIEGGAIMYMNRKGLQFSSRDCYSLRDTLGKINADAIRTFKETIERRDKEDLVYGLPYCVCEFDDDWDVEDWQASKKKWFDLLDEMIYAFEDKEPCPTDYYGYAKADERTRLSGGTIFESFNLVVDNPEGEKQYEADLAAHREKVDRGLRLFAEFYSDLWF